MRDHDELRLVLEFIQQAHKPRHIRVIERMRAVAAANDGTNIRINVICPGVVDTAIVPDNFRKPEFNMMPPDVLAAEVVDLLQQGANGEVRVKNAADRPAFVVTPPDLN